MAAADLPMLLTFAVIVATITLYALELYSIEAVSLGSLVCFILIFTIFPQQSGNQEFGVSELLAGFANPALITVLALLVIGQALFQTDALEQPVQFVLRHTRNRKRLAILAILIVAGAISALMNNTPVVVMFLPVLAAIAAAQGKSASTLLMPLSFIAILGGMTTLIGSSTNLLVADVAKRTAGITLEFFTFTPLGLILAAIGSVYVIVIMPRLLKPRKTMAEEMQEGTGKQFIAQIAIDFNHPLVGARSVAGLFPDLKNMTVRLVQRGEEPFLPPFENVVLQAGDTVIVAATRSALSHALSQRQSIIGKKVHDTTEPEEESQQPSTGISLSEAVVAPGSRFISRSISHINLRSQTGLIVLGIQRRSRMPRMAMTDMRLEAGDVLLLTGQRPDIERLRSNRDLLLMDWSTDEVPLRRYAGRAHLIFFTMVAMAASGLVPIVTASLLGCAGMLAAHCLNVRQALRAVDSRIFMLIGTSLAAGKALEMTGGAGAIADMMVALLEDQSPAMMLSIMFLVVSILTNILSNNATAVLFTPIAVEIATRMGVPVEAFVVCLIFAANCSFATPIGYQTNLIVMGPGHYRFIDFMRAGMPLVLVIWISFSIIAPWYYGF
ncbi:MAG: SLC13 family permease [Stappiaceae bacterium]